MALLLANVELTDTFNTWRVRTNSIIGASVEASNAQVSSSIIPTANVTFDLGTNELRFRDLYLSGNTIQLGAATLSSNGSSVSISLDGTDVFIGDTSGQQNSSDIVATGNVTATFFIGDGSQLTNAGSTVATDGGANRELSVPFTGITSGTMTSANVSSSLTFNPSTGTLTATAFSGDGSNLTNAGSTVATQTSGAAELRVTFTGITTGTMTTANVDPKLTYNPGSERLTANTVKVSNLQDSSGRTLTIRDAANTIVWGG